MLCCVTEILPSRFSAPPPQQQARPKARGPLQLGPSVHRPACANWPTAISPCRRGPWLQRGDRVEPSPRDTSCGLARRRLGDWHSSWASLGFTAQSNSTGLRSLYGRRTMRALQVAVRVRPLLARQAACALVNASSNASTEDASSSTEEACSCGVGLVRGALSEVEESLAM